MSDIHTPHRIQTVVIGGGQAGLSVGYHLARRGLEFVILESHRRVGDSWRQRWDSLRLFTPARFDGLVGMRFPAPSDMFPTKDEMADYLEAYAAHFNLPVLTGVTVDRLTRRGAVYAVSAGDRQFEADHVIVAMSDYQRCRVPSFARDLIRPSCSCTRPTIETCRSFGPEAFWWSAPAIPERTLRSRRHGAVIERGCLAGTLATCPSASTDSRDVCCWSDSCSEACSIACSR